MCHGQLISQALVQARKMHRCDSCGEHVERGMRYVKTVAVVEGDFQQSKLCPRCQALLEAYYDLGDVDACFDLSELRGMVNEMLAERGMFGKLKAKLRAWTAPGRGGWHT